MLRTFVLLVMIILVGFAGIARAQDASAKARELAAALDKTKYKSKENKFVALELYIDIRNEAAVRLDQSSYSGLYESDGSSMTLRVNPDGEATATGHDQPSGDGREIKFVLSGGHVEGALLTGSKIYENGETRKFEAVFVNRTVTTGRNRDKIDASQTTFGLGFVEGPPVVAGGGNDQTWTNRVFLEKKN